MIYEKIKILREKAEMTQAELAKRLGLSRAAINAWEMGITTPSTPYVIRLAQIFHVSTDYLFGLSSSATISIDGLSDREIAAVVEIINCFRSNKPNPDFDT